LSSASLANFCQSLKAISFIPCGNSNSIVILYNQ
jgi:hypothetical protein